MDVIPDPENPEKVGINHEGQLVYGVFAAPKGTPLDEMFTQGRFVGWTKGFTKTEED